MSKFDVEAAFGRIVLKFEGVRDEVGISDPSAVLPWMHKTILKELRAAVLAGREEALRAVLEAEEHGWTGDRGDGWDMAVGKCLADICALPNP